MGRVMLASEVQDAIRQQGDSVELTTPDGQLVGYYLSPAAYRKLRYQYANSLVTDDELEVSRQTPGRRTTEEVLGRLSSNPQT